MAREWTLYFDGEQGAIYSRGKYDKQNPDAEFVDVVEVLPDTVTISRQDLCDYVRDSWGFAWDDQGDSFLNDLEQRLFAPKARGGK